MLQLAHPAASGPTPLAAYEQALADLAEVLKHRLGNAAASIEGYAHLLVDLHDDPDARDLVLRIIEGVRQVEELVQEMEGFSQPMRPRPRWLTFADLRTELDAALGERASRLHVERAPDDSFCADPRQLVQALLVLLQNGFEASESGDAVMLDVWHDAATQRLCFDVWNAGTPGQDPDRLFSPFYTTKTRHLGLGLTLARRIALAHGGQVTLQHACTSRGTCFRLELPHPPSFV